MRFLFRNICNQQELAEGWTRLGDVSEDRRAAVDVGCRHDHGVLVRGKVSAVFVGCTCVPVCMCMCTGVYV